MFAKSKNYHIKYIFGTNDTSEIVSRYQMICSVLASPASRDNMHPRHCFLPLLINDSFSVRRLASCISKISKKSCLSDNALHCSKIGLYNREDAHSRRE